MKQIWFFIKENWAWYLLIGTLLLIVNGAQLVMPLFIGNIIDYISIKNPGSIIDLTPIWKMQYISPLQQFLLLHFE